MAIFLVDPWVLIPGQRYETAPDLGRFKFRIIYIQCCKIWYILHMQVLVLVPAAGGGRPLASHGSGRWRWRKRDRDRDRDRERQRERETGDIEESGGERDQQRHCRDLAWGLVVTDGEDTHKYSYSCSYSHTPHEPPLLSAASSLSLFSDIQYQQRNENGDENENEERITDYNSSQILP